MTKWALLLSLSLLIFSTNAQVNAQTEPRPDLTHYLRANNLATSGKHPQAIREYIAALSVTADPQIRYYCQAALQKYKLLPSTLPVATVSTPETRFAVARIVPYTEQNDLLVTTSTGYTAPFQATPYNQGYDAERSMLYQHGVWQAGGGLINTAMADHTHGPGGHAAQTAFRQNYDIHSSSFVPAYNSRSYGSGHGASYHHGR